MNPGNVLRGRRQTQKAQECVILFIWSEQKRQVHGDKVGEQPPDRGWRGADGPGVSFWWWWLHSSVRVLKSTQVYTWEWWILWYVTYISTNGLLKTVCAIPRAQNEQPQSDTHRELVPASRGGCSLRHAEPHPRAPQGH